MCSVSEEDNHATNFSVSILGEFGKEFAKCHNGDQGDGGRPRFLARMSRHLVRQSVSTDHLQLWHCGLASGSR